MRILIIGGAGFVGVRLACFLAEQGYEVSVMDNLARRGSEINLPVLRYHNVLFCHGDIRNREDFLNLRGHFDAICLAAAQPSAVLGFENPTFDIQNNALGVSNVLEFARAQDCGVIFWSTNKAYSADYVNRFERREEEKRWVWAEAGVAANNDVGFDPKHGFSEEFPVDGGNHGVYGLTKLMGDLMCQEYYTSFGVPTVVNRFSCLAGPGQFGKAEQGWVTWFALAFHFDFPLEIVGWNGKQVRDVLFIDDMCVLTKLQLENLTQVAGQVFNIGGGNERSLSLIEALELLSEWYGRSPAIRFVDGPRKADHCIYVSDIRKAKALLGWCPQVDLVQGYEQIIKWIETNEADLSSLFGLQG